jgi:hypothetical protein
MKSYTDILFLSTFSSEYQLDPSDVYRSLEPQSALGRPFAPLRKKKAKDGGKAYVDSTDAGPSVPGQVMPDTTGMPGKTPNFFAKRCASSSSFPSSCMASASSSFLRV